MKAATTPENNQLFINWSRGEKNNKMKQMVVLCLTALLVGSVQAKGGRGQLAQRKALNHLDVGLPNSLFGADLPLLIHLKDQGLWDKENGVDRGHSGASLLPSILKSIMTNQYQDEASDFEYGDVSSNAGLNNPHMMMRSLFDEGKLPVLEDLEEMVNGDEQAKELDESEKSQDKAHFYFKLRDALKSMYSHENEAESQGSKGLRSQAGRDGGIQFSLEDLEAQLKEKFPGAENIDLGSGGVSEKEVLVSLVELLKEYVAEETGSAAEPQSMEETKPATETEGEMANSRMVEQLTSSNVSVRVDNTGGIFFTLGDGQENVETTPKP